jgi:hypothetical protein
VWCRVKEGHGYNPSKLENLLCITWEDQMHMYNRANEPDIILRVLHAHTELKV